MFHDFPSATKTAEKVCDSDCFFSKTLNCYLQQIFPRNETFFVSDVNFNYSRVPRFFLAQQKHRKKSAICFFSKTVNIIKSILLSSTNISPQLNILRAWGKISLFPLLHDVSSATNTRKKSPQYWLLLFQDTVNVVESIFHYAQQLFSPERSTKVLE